MQLDERCLLFVLFLGSHVIPPHHTMLLIDHSGCAALVIIQLQGAMMMLMILCRAAIL